MKKLFLLSFIGILFIGEAMSKEVIDEFKADSSVKPRIIVTSDGEIDDQCSMIRFMLYTNECDVEGIISSSSQYHAHDHHWAGDDWIEPDLAAYAKVYPNLIKHDPAYPTPEYLRERIALGNVKTEGDMAEPTAGSNLIVKVLLDKTDERPIWFQAWGGMNTIACALKTIETEYPDRMAEVAGKCRFFFIWEQDKTYQEYIRPVWGKYEIPTIISDQFEAIAYRWKRVQPAEMASYFEGKWMRENILENHGPLCSIYASHENGDFRSEGDSPAFLHTIVNGLRNMESPDWGGWGGRYVRVRENTWLDPVPVSGYVYPEGRWYGDNGWGRTSLREWSTSTEEQRREYFKPMWRWTSALQNDFAARADWCVKSYEEANHPPVIKLKGALDLIAKPGETIELNALGTTDPDGDKLNYRWWQYEEADTYKGKIELLNAEEPVALFTVPVDVDDRNTIHVICEVSDSGSPSITRYKRVVIKIDKSVEKPKVRLGEDGVVEIPPMTAYFPMDSCYSNIVTDKVSGQKGILTNADPAVSWISGEIGKAVHFDGINDHIIIPHNDAFDFDEESFSITFWMRWPEGLPSGNQRILTKGDYKYSLPNEIGKRYEIYISGSNLRFSIDDNVAKSQIQVALKPYITGEWVHVAAVCDKENKRLKLYANGILLPTSNPGNPGNAGRVITGSIKNPRGLYIGDNSREDSPYQGDLDDLRFFRAALSNNQVAAIATKTPLREKEPEKADRNSKLLVAKESELPPLSAHFPLNEGQGLVVKELISGVETAIKNGDPDKVWTSSDNGLALKLDGIDDHIIIPNASGFDFKDESFSVAFHMRWIKGETPRHEHILCKGDFDSSVNGESGKRWEINVTAEGGLAFIVDDNVNKSQIQVSNESVLKGFWVHVVAVRNTENKKLELYINGELQESTNPGNKLYNGTDQTGTISNPRGLIIGNSSHVDNPLHGELSDIRIYRSALNASEVAGVARLKPRASANVHGYTEETVPKTINAGGSDKPRIIVTSDGEIDDVCSMIRFLLYSNEFDIEGIVTTSSQYHWQGHNWAGDDWEKPMYEAYGTLYPNLIKHDPAYPTLEYLQSITKLGNVKSEGEMTLETEGSQHIVNVLLDETDNRPIWLQAWGGTNSIARALKTIEEKHPEKMEAVAKKCRFYFIWEQDNTFQSYIREHWAKPYNITTIISDQFITFGYWWQRWGMPKEPDSYLREPWMKENIFKNDNPLISIYNEKTKIKLKGKEDFIGEGDSPAFMHMIPTGLRSTEFPNWGGWGGRYVLIRESTWLDNVPVEGYQYPSGRWYTKTGWGRQNYTKADQDKLEEYFKPITRWIGAIQNDFAARVDWCVKSYKEANHQPVVRLNHSVNLKAKPGETVKLSAVGTIDPDGDELLYSWWQYGEADSYEGNIKIRNSKNQEVSFVIPTDANNGDTIHIICEVSDNGTPQLTRYQRIVITINNMK